MALTAGTRLGAYEITAQIGVGGMGEVWSAIDTNLGRQVAIKILPDAFAQDSDRLARFEREAKTLASLNHPNIATIHALQEDDGIHFIVMEYVEGETLKAKVTLEGLLILRRSSSWRPRSPRPSTPRTAPASSSREQSLHTPIMPSNRLKQRPPLALVGRMTPFASAPPATV